MTHKENITAILECNFAGFKKEIIDNACNRILELEPKTGQWISHIQHCKMNNLKPSGLGYYWCSECNFGLDENQLRYANYCPNCGAKMVEPQESEEKE